MATAKGRNFADCRKGVGRIVRAYPSTILWPLAVLAVVLGLGVWGVTRAEQHTVADSKEKAQSIAEDAVEWCKQRVTLAATPVLVLSALVQHEPQFDAVQRIFDSVAPTLVIGAGDLQAAVGNATRGAPHSVFLAPNGVVRLQHPQASDVGLDLFAAGSQAAVVRAVRGRGVSVDGPEQRPGAGGLGVAIRAAVFVQDVAANDSMGMPDQLNPACGAPCAYDAGARTRFWGISSSFIPADSLTVSHDSRLRMLEAAGYHYELRLARADAAATSGLRGQVLAASAAAPAPSAVEAAAELPGAQWVLRVYPSRGWSPGWFAPSLTAAVVAIALVASIGTCGLLLSRRRCTLMLETLLPGGLAADMGAGEAVALGARLKQADTAASIMLGVVGCLLEGRAPSTADLALISSALRRNADVYQPLNLRSHIKEAGLDADVAQALMQQLGHSRPSTGSGGEPDAATTAPPGSAFDTVNDIAETLSESSPSLDMSHFCCTPLTSLSGALALLLTPRPVGWEDDAAAASDPWVGDPGCASRPRPRTAAGMVTGMASPRLNEVRDSDTPSGGSRSGAQLLLPQYSGSRGGSAAAEDLGAKAARTVLALQQLSMPPPPPMIEEVERVLAGCDDWQFDTWRLAQASSGHSLSCMAYYLIHRAGLIRPLKLRPVTLARALRALEAGYNGNPYHSATHAADVLQTLHVLLHGARLTEHYLDSLGLLAAYFAAVIHDYAHPGLTNDFLISTADPLAIRYNDRSPLESHHTAAAFALLARPELDVLAPLGKAERAAFRKQVIEMVLATDMKQHFAILGHFNTVHRLASFSHAAAAAVGAVAVAPPAAGAPGARMLPRRPSGSRATVKPLGQAAHADGDPPAEALPSLLPSSVPSGIGPPPSPAGPAPTPLDETERLLSLQVALKVADVGHLGKGMPVHRRWLYALEEEFFDQGDRERALGLPISPLFDRAKQGVSKSQVGFFDFVALPLMHAMAAAFPGAQPLMRCFVANYDHWKAADASGSGAAAH